jgi:lipoprotein LprG
VIIGQDLYLRPPTGGIQKLPLSFAGAVYDPSAILNPDKGISAALASGKDATTEAREQVDGVDTYRLQVTFPAQPLGSLVPGLATDKTSDIWVAVQGSRLIKAEFPTTTGNVTAQFSDYDAPAQITPPV